MDVTQSDSRSFKLGDDELADIFLLLQLVCDVSWHKLSSFGLSFLR